MQNVITNFQNVTDSFVYRGHAHPTSVAKFSPNGYWVASADISGKIRIWSWDNPEHILRLELHVFNGRVFDLDWDFESKRIVAVGEGSERVTNHLNKLNSYNVTCILILKLLLIPYPPPFLSAIL